MSENRKFRTADLTRLALVAASYAALTLALPGLSFGAVQFRLSELLVLLCYYRRDYSIAMIVGCFVANCFSPMALMDMVFGTLATAIAVIPMYSIRNIWLASLLPVVSNGVIVALELLICYGNEPPFWFNMLTVGAGELAVVTVAGCLLFKLLLERSTRFMSVIGASSRKHGM